LKVFYTDRSKDDIEIAFEWYEEQSKGLGSKFLDSIEEVLQNIIKYPEMYQIKYSNFRSSPIKKFPFSIFYTVEKNYIIVHSLFDNRKDPQKRP